MHIPDGYLSPQTCAVMYAVSVPFWLVAGRKVRATLTTRAAPLLAILAAFTFVIMMFNVPLPGGTSGHAAGGTLMAIVVGPWSAVIGVSIALAIQALLFGDGGILSLGANVFNMAIIMPFVGYGIYRLLKRVLPERPRQGAIAAGVAAYIALNMAALATAVEFGLQPRLFHGADGTPLYAPYGLSVAVPAMMTGHLLLAGVVEGLVTGLVVLYLYRAHPELLHRLPERASSGAAQQHRLRWLWVGLAVLVVLTPLGLLTTSTAWGEWGTVELRERGLGFVPTGLTRFADFWKAPLADYGVPGLHGIGAYVLSAAMGVAITAGLVVVVRRLGGRRRRHGGKDGAGATDTR